MLDCLSILFIAKGLEFSQTVINVQHCRVIVLMELHPFLLLLMTFISRSQLLEIVRLEVAFLA